MAETSRTASAHVAEGVGAEALLEETMVENFLTCVREQVSRKHSLKPDKSRHVHAKIHGN